MFARTIAVILVISFNVLGVLIVHDNGLAEDVGSTCGSEQTCQAGRDAAGELGRPQALQVRNDVILVGVSTALSGMQGVLGRGKLIGYQAAFQQRNSHGGIAHKKLQLMVFDDADNATQAAINIRRLIDDFSVLALLGGVSSHTSLVAQEIAGETKVPLIIKGDWFEGLETRGLPERYVFSLGASVPEQMAQGLECLTTLRGISVDSVGVVTQAGRAADIWYDQVPQIDPSGVLSFRHWSYEPQSTRIEGLLADVLESNFYPQVIFLSGNLPAVEKFMSLSDALGYRPFFIVASHVGLDSRETSSSEHRDLPDNTFVLSSLPSWKSKLKGAKEFRAAMDEFFPNEPMSSLSFEGYVFAQVLIKGLEKAAPGFSRENLVTGLESLGEFDVGIGETIALSQFKHQQSFNVRCD